MLDERRPGRVFGCGTRCINFGWAAGRVRRDHARRHKEPVYRLIRGYIGDAEEALDLVQDCFTSAFKGLGRYDEARPFRAWISGIAINKCRDWARPRALRSFLLAPAPAAAAAGAPDPAPGADAAAGDRQELEQLRKAITELPRSLKEPLVLHTIEGLPGRAFGSAAKPWKPASIAPGKAGRPPRFQRHAAGLVRVADFTLKRGQMLATSRLGPSSPAEIMRKPNSREMTMRRRSPRRCEPPERWKSGLAKSN